MISNSSPDHISRRSSSIYGIELDTLRRVIRMADIQDMYQMDSESRPSDFLEVINSSVVVKIPNPTDISLVWVPF
ncbi:hypothetical protein TNCV_4406921 [Trichonephila clavipes]|nr:hypothetical protein TNCV_4406921 [Trichonephila clavipes]